MRLQRVAAMIAAAVGIGFLVVGCGPPPASGSGATTGKSSDSSKITPASRPATGSDKSKDLTDKAKAAYEENNKEYEVQKKALEALKEKVTTDKKNAGADANKLDAADKLEEKKDAAEKLMKDIGDKLAAIKDLKDIKDVATLDAVVKAVKESLDKVKPMLKDYLPK